MSEFTLTAELRTETGKGPARRLRQAGRVPAILYGADQDNKSLSVDARLLAQVVQRGGQHNLLKLEIEGGAEKTTHQVLIKDLEQDPVREDILHVDFHAVALDQEMQTVVPVEVTGEEGRTDDGVVTVVLRELNITCLPTAIPESIVVDVSELAIGDVITVADIVAPEGVSIVHEADEAVVTVTPPQTEADAETDEVGEGEGDETAGGEE